MDYPGREMFRCVKLVYRVVQELIATEHMASSEEGQRVLIIQVKILSYSEVTLEKNATFKKIHMNL